VTQKQQFTLAVAAVIILALAGVAYYATVYSVTKTEFEVYTTCLLASRGHAAGQVRCCQAKHGQDLG